MHGAALFGSLRRRRLQHFKARVVNIVQIFNVQMDDTIRWQVIENLLQLW